MENKDIVFILVRPQLGENIGAVARVMLNFGFSNLRLVNPRDGWPNKTAVASAAGADKVIKNILKFDSLENALKDIDIVYATTNRKRNLNIQISSVKNLSKQLNLNNKTAILFGAENNGLSNQELSYANELLYIDTNEEFPSLNLAQALGIVAYEISKFKNTKQQKFELASKQELSIFINFVNQNLMKNKFFKDEFSDLKKLKIANIFNRINNLTTNDIGLLYGIIRSFKN